MTLASLEYDIWHRVFTIFLNPTCYLIFQAVIQNDLPNSICQECCDTLENFDAYAAKCEKVQSMFRAFVQTEVNQDDDSVRAHKYDFFENTVDEKKFVPICVLKVYIKHLS